MQSGGRLVEDVERPAFGTLGEFRREFDALGFASGKGVPSLPQLHVAQAHVLKRLEDAANAGLSFEQLQRLRDFQPQHISDRLPSVGHGQRLTVVALALAGIAGNPDIREEVHLDEVIALPIASGTASFGSIEGKATFRETPCLGFGHHRKDIPDRIQRLGVGRRVRARSAANRFLVNDHELRNVLQPRDFPVRPNLDSLSGHPALGGPQECVHHQRGFPGTRNPRHHCQHTQREFHINLLEVVLGCPLNQNGALRIDRPALFRNQDSLFATEVLSGNRTAFVFDLLRTPGGHHHATVVPRPRSHVHQVICLSDHLKIVFDHDDCVAQVPQPLEGADETVRIAGVQADGGFIKNVHHTYQSRADLRCQPNALSFSAGKGGSSLI